MPKERRKDDGGTGAPILNHLRARVKLVDVEEHEEPFEVKRKKDNATFTLDPGFYCTVEVIDDGDDGEDDGTTFFEGFRYKLDGGEWILKEYSKLGALAEVVKPGYFEEESIPALTADDLEGFEFVAWAKPKKNPVSGAIIGTTLDWETFS